MVNLAKYIELYRPQYVAGIDEFGYVKYELGHLRAKLFGIRVPVLWALDRLTIAAILKV